ncbi:MAG: flagellin [Desulfobacteraceae bacterium]|nr:flagellin [Desulfobacteraceae bacterium]
MALTINTNVASLNAQRNLSQSQNSLNTAMERLSSGLRINSAKDDAAGLAISDRMTSQVRGLNQAVRNANDGISLAQTAEGALQEATNIMQRMRELAVQSGNETNTDTDRQSMNAEFQSLMEELNRIADTTSFNGKNVLDGSIGDATYQVGPNVGETVSVDMGSSMRTDSIGNYVTQSFSLQTDGTATDGDTWGLANDGDLSINGVSIDAASDNSYGQGDGSAKSIAEAINAKTADHGVEANAQETVKEVSSSDIESFGFTEDPTNSDDSLEYGLSINGVSVESKTEADSGSTAEVLAQNINAVSSDTGVTATVEDDGGMTLKASDGRNIEIQETLSGSTSADDDKVTGYFGTTLTASGSDTATNFDISKADLKMTASQDIRLDFDETNATDEPEQLFNYSDGTSEDTLSTQSLATSDILSIDNANDSIYRLDQSIQDVDVFRGDLGAAQNRLESTIANLQNVSENLSAARSRIMDADIAQETSEMTKQNVLQQAGVSILAQANQAPQIALSLLQ